MIIKEKTMAEFIYTTVPGKIQALLNKIREVGVPQKASSQWLKSLGFKSSNDASLIGVLKFIGFIDSSGSPSPKWNLYRGTNHRKVLGDAIREGYSDLFAVYPDANQQSQSDLDHVFSTSSSSGKQVIVKKISTFKALAEKADFAPVSKKDSSPISLVPTNTPPAPPATAIGHGSYGPALHIDIQIHISPEATVDQIDQIFASMSKHLYDGKKTDK